MLAHDNLQDYPLFPDHDSYPDLLGHSQMRQDASYSEEEAQSFMAQSALDHEFAGLPMTTDNPYASVLAFSAAPRTSFYEAPQFVVEAPRDQSKRSHYPSPQTGSPISATQSFDPPPSTFSSASGASLPSAASSALGSPYSGPSQKLHSAETWPSTSTGLGINPSIVQSEPFTSEVYGHAYMDHDIFADPKSSTDFVGECGRLSSSLVSAKRPIFSSSTSQFPVSSSAASSRSSAPAPAFARNPSLETRTDSGSASNIGSIDTIIEEAGSQMHTPRSSVSPSAVLPGTSMPAQDVTAHRNCSEAGGHTLFRSPTTPASVAAGRSPRFAPPDVNPWRRHSHTGAGITKPYRKDASPKQRTTNLSSEAQAQRDTIHSNLQTPFFSQSSDPHLIHTFQTPTRQSTGAPELVAYQPAAQHISYFQPPSPAPSNSSARSRRPGSMHIKNSPSPHLTASAYPYPAFKTSRRQSTSSNHSRFSSYGSNGSPHSIALDSDDDRGRCPHPDCGKIFKDLKAHMLTHQSERPEKCPIMTCEYHQKGFARKYDKNRHTLTHYKGTMVCGFCPGSGSSAEKSFNRADVFKRHLTSVHGVEQAPPNSRKKNSPSTSTNKKFPGYSAEATGKCSTCSGKFNNAQEFYEHLDDCVLRVVQQEDPSEAINARNMGSMNDDEDVERTLRANALPVNSNIAQGDVAVDAEEDATADDDGNADEAWTSSSSSGNARSGKGTVAGAAAQSGGGSAVRKSQARGGAGLTFSKGGVTLAGKGRKKRKHYPLSWGCPSDKMKMKKRVLCVYDGQRRLWKDDMMLDSEFEVRLKLGEGDSYVTDLDIQTLKRAEAFHNATEEEKGPWPPASSSIAGEVDLEELMAQ
ncbi:MAG: hypothetical protein M1825_000092 [Sarcosagium campestre]|nr:MAG: hypothetical protein M1825_000092 [Sarcosagium campestre]